VILHASPSDRLFANKEVIEALTKVLVALCFQPSIVHR